MIRILFVAVFIAAASVILALALPEADGCASVRQANGPSIHIAEESAIIVWDPVKKMQHFIRRAAFDTKSPDFGFLVPTPTTPELPLKEVEDGVFRAMDQWILPRTVEQTRWKFEPLMCTFFLPTKMAGRIDMAAKDGVRVLHEQKVGGFDVSVLEADDAEALTKWIKDHGYSADPELYEWLTPYVAGKWTITAFKITQDPKTGQLATTKAVRMSFKTERPFFPYREPEQKPKKDVDKKLDKADEGKGPRHFHFDEKGDRIWNDSRMLRVYFVSDTRMEGKLGNAAWHAKIPWSDALTDEQRTQLAKETCVPEDALPAQAWLTTFEDRAEPRPGKEEVYFDPAAVRTPIRPPDFVKYNDVWIPFDCALVSLILISILVFAVVALARRRAKAVT